MNQNKEQFERLFNNEMSVDEARSFLVGLAKKGETAKQIATAASIMRSHSIKLPISKIFVAYSKQNKEQINRIHYNDNI